jgi:hypothetical protein
MSSMGCECPPKKTHILCGYIAHLGLDEPNRPLLPFSAYARMILRDKAAQLGSSYVCKLSVLSESRERGCA